MDLFELGSMLTCGSSIEEIANFQHQFSDGRIRVTRWPREPAPCSRLLTTAAARSPSSPCRSFSTSSVRCHFLGVFDVSRWWLARWSYVIPP